MASIQIHIVIGEQFLNKNKNINRANFMKGIIEPDLIDDGKMHYSTYKDKTNLKDYLKNKVNLKEYLAHHQVSSDYDRGVFLHLITDYLFFNDFFDSTYINNIDYNEFCKDLYYSYPLCTKLLEEKYGSINYYGYLETINKDIEKSRKEKNINVAEERKNILPNSKIIDFINEVSSIDLEEYQKNKIQ